MKKLLQSKRHEFNLTQAELADVLAVSEHYVYLIEAGLRKPSVSLAKRIGEVLHLDWTLFYEENAS